MDKFPLICWKLGPGSMGDPRSVEHRSPLALPQGTGELACRLVAEAGVVEEASSRSVRALHILLNPGVAYIPKGGTLEKSCDLVFETGNGFDDSWKRSCD